MLSINITEAIYNSDFNKTSTIHLNPYFSMIFFFRQMHHVFHSLKYYTVKKKLCIFFTFSCNSGGKQQPSSILLKHISVTTCQNTFWSWQNEIPICLQFLCFTQRVLITVVHDKNYYKQSTLKLNDPSLYIL